MPTNLSDTSDFINGITHAHHRRCSTKSNETRLTDIHDQRLSPRCKRSIYKATQSLARHIFGAAGSFSFISLLRKQIECQEWRARGAHLSTPSGVKAHS